MNAYFLLSFGFIFFLYHMKRNRLFKFLLMGEVINDIMQSVCSTWGPIIGHRFRSLKLFSLRASSPIWASEVSLARLALLAQIGELARRLEAFGSIQLRFYHELWRMKLTLTDHATKKRIKLFQFSFTGEKTLKKIFRKPICLVELDVSFVIESIYTQVHDETGL